MMKLIHVFLILVLAESTYAQSGITWSAETDVAPSNLGNLHPRLAVDSAGNPLVIWGRFSTSEVYFSKWIDTAFSSPVVLNPVNIPASLASWAGPDIASHGDTVYVVYKQTPEDTNHIYLQRSFDGGMNFSAPIQVDLLTDSISSLPVVTTDDAGNPVVAYLKFETGYVNPSYVVCRSNDFGDTFTHDVLASLYSGASTDECSPGAIICSGNNAALLYRDNFNDFRTIWCGVSSDNGASFPFGMPMDNTTWITNSCPSSGPDGIIIGDSVYTVFMSGASGDALSYICAASLSTTSFGNTLPLLPSSVNFSNQNFPRISNSGNKVGVVCRQTYNGDGQLAFFYADDIVNGLSGVFDTLATGSVTNCDIAMTANAVHVIWQDDNSETVKYRKGTYSTTNIKNKFSDNNLITIYPSPAKDNFSIRFKNSNVKISSIHLTDFSCRNVLVPFSFSSEGLNCNIQSVSPGIYFVSIFDTEGKSYFKKITIIQR